jgi:hypothetical protein
MLKLTFNTFTGNFDYVVDEEYIKKLACEKALEAIQGIQTSNTNALGNKHFTYDPVACKWVELPPIPVTDENGNLVVSLKDTED